MISPPPQSHNRAGEVQFIQEEDGLSTTVIFKLEHHLPNLLADVNVNAFGVETSCRAIFGENLQQFRRIAEAMASGAAVHPEAVAEDEEMRVGVKLLLGDVVDGGEAAEGGPEDHGSLRGHDDEGLEVGVEVREDDEDVALDDDGEEGEQDEEDEDVEEAPLPAAATGEL